MKISLALISTFESLFVTLFLSTGSQYRRHHVISICLVSASILFAQCFANDLTLPTTATRAKTTTPSVKHLSTTVTPSPTATTTTKAQQQFDGRKQWLNDAITVRPISMSSEALTDVDRQSTTASKPFNRNYLSSNEAISIQTLLSSDNGSFTSSQILLSSPSSDSQKLTKSIDAKTTTTSTLPFTSHKLGQTVSFSPDSRTSSLYSFHSNTETKAVAPSLKNGRPQSANNNENNNNRNNNHNNVLVLIQSTKHIKLKLVRDQFQQFLDSFSVKLQNITIDFDIIDGKYSFIYLYLCNV